ncbi:hypothetical protein D1BOALGB6SA_2624 [Olavius sp. associated proteobacterium Delta 1]|nr:hypothetical protein D1BOALGB6SA_2624 [Olavius sp. associated proteobacterium Delta 1]
MIFKLFWTAMHQDTASVFLRRQIFYRYHCMISANDVHLR